MKMSVSTDVFTGFHVAISKLTNLSCPFWYFSLLFCSLESTKHKSANIIIILSAGLFQYIYYKTLSK